MWWFDSKETREQKCRYADRWDYILKRLNIDSNNFRTYIRHAEISDIENQLEQLENIEENYGRLLEIQIWVDRVATRLKERIAELRKDAKEL